MVFFIICVYERNMWMLSVLFAGMNGISECFLYCFYINGIYACLLCRLFTSMEFSDVFFAINLWELNMWMLSLLFVYMNGNCGCFYYLFISVNVFFFSLLIYMNRKYARFLYCLSKWIEFVNISCIVCLYIWWWWRYCGLDKYCARFCCFF